MASWNTLPNNISSFQKWQPKKENSFVATTSMMTWMRSYGQMRQASPLSLIPIWTRSEKSSQRTAAKFQSGPMLNTQNGSKFGQRYRKSAPSHWFFCLPPWTSRSTSALSKSISFLPRASSSSKTTIGLTKQRGSSGSLMRTRWTGFKTGLRTLLISTPSKTCGTCFVRNSRLTGFEAFGAQRRNWVKFGNPKKCEKR